MHRLTICDVGLSTKETYISCHLGKIPSFVKEELKTLSDSIAIRLDGKDRSLSTYVVSQEGRPIHCFLFQIEGRTVKVINRVPGTSQAEIARFAEYMFSKFARIDIISFTAVHTNVQRIGFPYHFQHYNSTEAFVLALPRTRHEYEQHLGKSTRRTLRYYSGKVKRCFPTFSCHVYLNEEIREEDILSLLALRDARMSAKKMCHGFSEDVIKRMILLARTSGLMTVFMIDGHICAGSLNFNCGSHYVGYILTHDGAYKDFRLGMLCAYATISEVIDRGGVSFDLGSERFDYKTSLLGLRLDMDRLEIYRSARHMALNPGNVMKTLIAGLRRKVRLSLLARRHSAVAQLVFHALFLLRKHNQEARSRAKELG